MLLKKEILFQTGPTEAGDSWGDLHASKSTSVGVICTWARVPGDEWTSKAGEEEGTGLFGSKRYQYYSDPDVVTHQSQASRKVLFPGWRRKGDIFKHKHPKMPLSIFLRLAGLSMGNQQAFLSCPRPRSHSILFEVFRLSLEGIFGFDTFCHLCREGKR